jgi:hypothetical protein
VDGWGRSGGAAQNELLEAELKERAKDFEGDLRKKSGFKISLACRRRRGAANVIAKGHYGGRTCANNCWYGMETANRCVERGVTMADDWRASRGLQRGSCETGQVVLLWRIPFTTSPLVHELFLLLASFATPWSRAPYSLLYWPILAPLVSFVITTNFFFCASVCLSSLHLSSLFSLRVLLCYSW